MTTTLTSRYAIGDRVWHAWTKLEQGYHPCPDCHGSGKWKAVSPAGDEFAFNCPRCAASYHSNLEMGLSYPMHTASVRAMTIGSIRMDTASDRPVEYMCVETGVGSGSVYCENDLFSTEEDAQRVAEARTIETNTTTPWIAKRFNQALELCDYQLESAELKTARDLRIRNSVDLQMLFEDLREAEDIDGVKEILEKFHFRSDNE